MLNLLWAFLFLFFFFFLRGGFGPVGAPYVCTARYAFNKVFHYLLKKCNAQKSLGILIMAFFVELCIENLKFHLK